MGAKDIKDNLKSGSEARLIPVLADTSKENRATSVFLACLGAVDEFGKVMLGSIGQRVGKRAKIECFTEVVLEHQENKKDRPDGLVILKVQGRQWSALVESKIAGSKLDHDQVARYVRIARINGIDAVITISNQFAAIPTHHPIKLPKNQSRGVELYHWSWTFMLTQAILLLKAREGLHVDQAYLLNEMARYFRHDSSGVRPFDRMNPEWKEVVLRVKSGAALAKTSPEVESTVGSWHQEQRDLCLILSRRLGVSVSQRLSRLHRANPEKRLKDDCEKLAKEKKLNTVFEIPDAAAALEVTADIARRTVSCFMSIEAPKDRKTAKARINWIIKQVAKADPSDVFIEADWPSRAAPTQMSLAAVRENPLALAHVNARLVPTRFKISLVRDIAGRFSGSKTFIEELEHTVPDFYERIGEHLRQWVPPAPKIESAPKREEPDSHSFPKTVEEELPAGS